MNEDIESLIQNLKISTSNAPYDSSDHKTAVYLAAHHQAKPYSQTIGE